MGGCRAFAFTLAGTLVLATVPVHAESAAIWAQSNDDTAIRWSGSKGNVNGLIHSNGGIAISGSKNNFTAGAEYVSTFVNNKPNGKNANTVTPAPVQVAPAPFPRSYSISDYMPGGAAAMAAGGNYVDLSSACAAGGSSGVSVKFNKEAIPDRLYFAPCDVLFDAKDSNGNVTVVATGDIHYKTHKNSQISAYVHGILAMSTSTGDKAIHLNGNKSAMQGDVIAEFGEIHLAGSNQTLSCGIYGQTVKFSGSSFTVGGENCGFVVANTPPIAVDDAATTFVDIPVAIDILTNDSDADGQLDPSSVAIVSAPANGTVSVDASAGVATYSPNPGFVGSDLFEYTVSDDDGAASQPATVTIDVEDINAPPIAADDAASTAEDQALSLLVLANDSDNDGVLDVTSVTIVLAPTNGTAVVNLTDGSVDYTPDVDFFGSDSFVYTVRDDDGAVSNEATVSIEVTAVNDPPVVQDDSASGVEDQPLAIDVLSNDSDVDSAVSISGVIITTPPTNGSVTVDTELGVLVYTADPDFYGSDSFTYRLYDNLEAGSVNTATVQITIGAVNDVPQAPDAIVDLSEDGSANIELQGTDADGDPLTYTVLSGPTSGSLTGDAPNLTYTPQPNFSGTDSITYSASDGTASSDPATITFNVLAVNDSPVMADQVFPGTEDTVLALTVIASDIDGDVLTFSITSPPSNGTLTGTGPDYSYTPNADFEGDDAFVISVDDGAGGTDSAIITLSMAAVNDAPQATAQSVTTGEDNALVILLAGSDVDGDTLTFSVTSGPLNGALSGTEPTLTYTPDPNFNGTDSITFVANDGTVNSAPATISITVSAGNDLPVANDQSVSTNEDTPLLITLTGSDIDGDPLTYSIASPPAGGALTGTAPNLIYTPAQDFNGPDSFTFSANDGTADSLPGTISINVAPINDTPVANDSNVSTDEDVAAAFVLQGSDVDGDGLTYTIVQSPNNGAVTGTAPNLVYTPNANFNGSDSLTFTVTDGQETSNIGTVSFSVAPVNDGPTASAQLVSVSEDGSIAIQLTGTDPEGDALTFAIFSAPTYGSISGTEPNLVYTPVADFNGTDEFAFTVSDGIDTSAPALISITIDAVNDTPVANAQDVITDEDTPVAIVLTGSDIDGDTLTFSVETQPTDGTLSGAAPNLTYTPDAEFNGTDSFTFIVNDGSVDSATATVSITVNAGNDAPVADDQDVATDEDSPIAITLTGSDIDGDGLTYSVATPPSNGSLGGTAPNLTYTPNADYNGPDSFTFRVNDGTVDSALATVSITVNPGNDAPIANDQGVTTAEDTPVAITLTGSDIDGDTLTFSVETQPTDGTLSGAAPNLTYTPDTDSNGSDTFTFLVNDGTADSAPATVSITVNAGNDAPIANDQIVTTDEDSPIAITLTGSDIDGDGLTYAVQTQPTNGLLSGTVPNVTYTPNADFNGSDSFTYVANDGTVDSAAATVSITVNPGNDAPVADDQTVTTPEDTPVAITLAGSDIDGDTLTYSVATQPTNGSLSGTAPNLTYTPNVDFNGSDSFTFTVNDATVDSAPATVSITVNPGNDAPVADDQTVTTPEDTPVAITLTGSDIDGDALTFAVETQPTNGSLSGTVPNLTYTPSADFNGVDSFTFTVNDGAVDSAPATVSITVNDNNDAPVADDQGVTTDEDTPVAITLTGSDIDGDALTYSVATQPTNGSLSGTAPNVTYTPNADFNGSDSFTFTVNDGTVDSAPATLSITVSPGNDAPIADDQGVTTAEDTPVAITLTGSDIDGDALTFSVATQPTNGTLSGTAPNLTYTPSADVNGPDSFTFTVNDGTVDSAAATISITVNASNDAPVADDQTVTTPEDTPVPITLTGSDPDGDVLTYVVTGTPTNGTLTGTAPALTYTPATNFNGTDELRFTVSDASVTSAEAVVSITIDPVNDIPVAASFSVAVSEGQATPVNLSGSDDDGDVLTYSIVSPPANGTLTGTAPALSYTSNPGFAGTDSLTYLVNDGTADSALATVTLNVTADPNEAPEFTQIPLLNAPVGELYQSRGQAVDPDGDDITISLGTAPSGAGVTDLGGGAFELTWPSTGDVGDSVNIDVIATDSLGASSTLSLTILVTGSRVGNSHLGTEFWAAFGFNYNNASFGLGAMPLSDPGRSIQMLIGAPDGASGLIEVASEGFSQPFTVAAGETITVDLPTSTMSTSGNIRSNAVHVTSDTPITVAGLNWAFATTDAFLVLPVTALGSDYLVTGYANIIWSHIPPLEETMYSILGVEDGTTVTITPVAGAPAYAGDNFRDPQVITLNRGEVKMAEIEYVHAISVSADRPVAVFAGSACADVPNEVSTCDHLWSQFLPDSSLASRYLSAPIATRSSSLYRILANEDDTQVFVNDQYVANLNRGDKFERMLSGPLDIVASKPVVAVQYSPGNQFDRDTRQNDLADPFMINLAPVDAFLSDYVFVVPSGEGVFRDQPNNTIRLPIEEHHVSVIIPAVAASSLVLDGVPVDTTGFVPVGSTDFLSGTLPMTPGTHRMAANDAFGLHVYGFGLEESYGYYAGLIFPDGAASLDVTATGPVSSLTTGSDEACLDLEIRDLGGLLIPRARFQITITGPVNRSYTGFSDDLGRGQYCYTQPQPGTDNITVSVAGDSELLSVSWVADTDPGTNGAPQFISLPELILYDQTFVYNVEAVDPDGDNLTITVSDGPAGAMYSDVSGQVTWTPVIPANREPTLNSIELTATDPSGASATQRFEVTVYYPPLITQFPTTSFVTVFGGRRETGLEHIGGDDKLIQGRVTAGSGGTSISRFDLYDTWNVVLTPISFDHVEGVSETNPMCRAPGTYLGRFGTDERFFDGSFQIPAASAGPVVDTNNDGTIDNQDDIYSFHSERNDTVRLYNLTTRSTEWVDTNVDNRQNHQPAIVNLDSDPEMEFVVAGRQLLAFDTDGTPMWQSSASLVGFYRADHISVVASDLDGDGVTELLYGPQVFDANGVLLWQSDAQMPEGTERVIAVPADIDGDGEQEVLLGDQVRDTDGTLLWTMESAIGAANAQVMHAVADIDGDSDLEIFAAVFTNAGGARMIAFDGDGSVLWNVQTQGVTVRYAGIPSIADFNLDGELEIYQPTAKTLISADGRILSEFDTGDGGIIEQKIFDLNGDGVYEIFDGRQEFEFYLSRLQWGTSGSGHGVRFGDYNSFKFVDSDHDGRVELLITSSSGLGLYETEDGSWQMPERDYRQHLYYDTNGFNVDAYAPPAPSGLVADAWVGELAILGSLAGGYSFAADVANRATANIEEDITVRFYRGIPSTGTLLDEVTIVGGLTAGERRTISVPVARADLDGMMSAELVFSAPFEQCTTQNDIVAGTFTELEIWDGPSEYRTDRFSFIYRISQTEGDISWLTTPPTSVVLGQTLVYDADAVAPNFGDSVRYGLGRRYAATPVPKGATIDTLSGVMTWTPTFDQIGTHTFRVGAASLVDGDSQDLFIEVLPRANEAPVITTTPPAGLVFVGNNYSYDVDATDADGDTLLYELTVAPAGMTIDSATGLVGWTPEVGQNGLHAVTVSVDDAFGGVTTQSYTIQVGSTANTPPNITSVPPFFAKATFEYQYLVVVDDPDGDFITYSVETGPSGMAIDGNGLLSWTPDAGGFENVTVRASDGQAFVDQSWTITINEASVPLEAFVSANPAIVDLNDSVFLTVGYTGAAGPVSLSLTVDGNPIPLSASGEATVLADTVGLHTATAIVTDPYGSDSATTTFTVVDPNSTSSPPVVSLTTPDFEEEVTAPRDAIGTVDDPDDDLLNWELILQSRGAPPTDFTVIASGTTEVPEDVLGQIDPTMLMNGLYSVILQATDAAGNVSQDVRVIRVTGDLKVGNFSITFEDFSAPVAGIPVTVLRTYDSRQRNENLDFGYGWTIDYQNVRIQESRDIGFSWLLIEEDLGLFSQWCVRPNGDPTVTVRMPDGEVETFVARAEPECTQIVPETFVQIVFDPIDGTDSALVQNDYGTVTLIGGNIEDPGTPGPVDPDSYTLTTPEGLVFDLDQSFGIRSVTDPNGNSLTYSNSGVIHNQGFSLSFVRDGVGRITSIVAPDGTTLDYGYDANGDLTSFTDQVNQVTTYAYKAGVDHYLEDIIDPRGIRISRNEYDADGRLIAVIDADGNRIEYDHDIVGRTETVRDRRGNPTIYVYDDEGNILLETNALGETITRTYDADRNVLSETNDLGHTTSWTYDERGNVLTETNPEQETTTSTYDNRNLLLTQVDSLGNPVLTNVYDANTTNLLTMTDAIGGTTTFDWDTGIGGGCSTGASNGMTDAELNRFTVQPQCVGPFGELPAWEEDARGVRTSFGYDSLGRVISETTTRTDDLGTVRSLVTTMDYDDKGRVVRMTDPEGRETVREYNSIDKESALIDPNLERIEFDYDARGFLTQARYPNGTSEQTGYDEEGNVISKTDRAGRTTRMTYDAANRLIDTIYPDATPGNDLDNPRKTNEYDRAGRLVAVTDERGNRMEYEYDDAGRRTLVRDALLNETRFEYDARGLQVAMVDALNRRTEFVYDDVGRLIETIFPDNTPGDPTDNLRGLIGYDALGRKISETDLAGLTTRFEHDEVGNLTAVIDALSQRTEYGYDEQSNKISQTDAELRTTTWTYDDTGRPLSRILPEGQTESFAYDGNGNRIAHTDFNGNTHTYTFDPLNREQSASYVGASPVSTTYTATGQLATVTDSRGTTSYVYDERDRLTRLDYPNGKWIEYSYDATGNRTSLTTANQSVTYSFDVLNRLESVTDEAGTTTYGYDAVGNRTNINHANGTRTEYIYDSLNRLTRLDQFDSFGALFARHSYTLGPNGNRTQHAELTGRVVDYTYDDLYRLTDEVVTDTTVGNRESHWTYDAVGNRLTQTEIAGISTTTTTYTYDDNDRLLTEIAAGAAPASVAYSYDNNGNTLTKNDGTAITTYAYDSRNRLSSLNAGQVTYQYDATGIRMSETTAANLTTHYLVDPNREHDQVIEESYDLNAFSEVRYTYGHDLVSQHRRVDATTTSSSTYHYDGVGSTRQLSNSAGAVTDSYVFEAFGELEWSNGVTTNDYLFTGEQYDPNLGFYYLRARYLNPATGRFVGMDAFPGFYWDPQTLHKYTYANLDPVDNIDPSGNVTLRALIRGLDAGVRLALSNVRAGFAVSRVAGGRALRALGMVVERSVGAVLKRVIGRAGVRGQIRLEGAGGRRIIDFFLKLGDRIAFFEAKYQLPSRAGQALTRLVGQIRTAQTAAQATNAQVVLWTYKAPTAAQMAVTLGALGESATGVQLVHGLAGAAQWARWFFLL